MTGVLLRSEATGETAASLSASPNEVFFCPEESQFYSHCLERLVFNECTQAESIIEFGCGDGSPVINSLLRTQFNSTIHGYELNPAAYQVAQSRIRQLQLSDQYRVYNQSFFDAPRPRAEYLIANPPYIPAPDEKIHMPLLRGGIDGATLTNQLLSLNYPSVMLLISSYSNPINTLNHAIANGYNVADFMVTPLKFGYYSSQPKVKKHIEELRQQRKAFYSKNIYFLAGVLFRKQILCHANLAPELTQVMTAL